MSGTTLPLVEPAMTQSPLNQATSQSTSLASNGLAGAAMVVIAWVVWKVTGVTLPPEVAVAAAILIQGVVHPFYVEWTKMPSTKTAGVITPAVVAKPIDPAPIPPKASPPVPAPVPAPPQPPKAPV